MTAFSLWNITGHSCTAQQNGQRVEEVQCEDLDTILLSDWNCVRCVAFSQPNINGLTVLGCMLCLSCIFLLGLDGKFVSATVYPYVCQVSRGANYTRMPHLFYFFSCQIYFPVILNLSQWIRLSWLETVKTWNVAGCVCLIWQKDNVLVSSKLTWLDYLLMGNVF